MDGGCVSMFNRDLDHTLLSTRHINLPPHCQLQGFCVSNLYFVNVYIHSAKNMPEIKWIRVLNFMDKEFLIMGDLNRHNTSWDCEYMDTNGRILASIADNHLVVPKQTQLAQPEEICHWSSSFLAPKCVWSILGDIGHSYHYLTVCGIGLITGGSDRIQTWKKKL